MYCEIEACLAKIWYLKEVSRKPKSNQIYWLSARSIRSLLTQNIPFTNDFKKAKIPMWTWTYYYEISGKRIILNGNIDDKNKMTCERGLARSKTPKIKRTTPSDTETKNKHSKKVWTVLSISSPFRQKHRNLKFTEKILDMFSIRI